VESILSSPSEELTLFIEIAVDWIPIKGHKQRNRVERCNDLST